MTAEQSAAFAQLRALARPHRFRVLADAEGFPIIPARRGRVEWFHAEGTHLAAYTAGRLTRGRLLALPGILRHQVGDEEVRVLVPVAQLADVARVLGARRRRQGRPLTPEQARALAERARVALRLRRQDRAVAVGTA